MTKGGGSGESSRKVIKNAVGLYGKQGGIYFYYTCVLLRVVFLQLFVLFIIRKKREREREREEGAERKEQLNLHHHRKRIWQQLHFHLSCQSLELILNFNNNSFL